MAVGDFHGPGGGGSGKSVGYGLPGAYAEYVRIPNAQTPGRIGKIPEELDFDEAAALEPLRCGLHAAKLASPEVNDWAVVIGAGMIGLACMQVQIALFEHAVEFDPTIITQKQIRLQGCAGGVPFALAADLVRTGRIRIKPFITHHFSLEKITEAFETQMRSDVSGKVVVAPWLS